MSYLSNLTILHSPIINAKIIGITTIQTTENGRRRFVPLMIVLENTGSQNVTVPPTISIGFTGASYTDIFPATQAVGLNVTDKVFVQPVPATNCIIPPVNTSLVANVSVAATAIICRVRIGVIGYYI
jgi:hypothetical protein